MMVTIRMSLGWTGVHQDATTTMSTWPSRRLRIRWASGECHEGLMMVTIRMSLGVHQDVTQYNADTTELLLTLACVSCVTPSLHLWAGSASDIWLYTPGHPGWPGPVSPVTIIVSSRHSAAMYSSYLWGMCLSDVNASWETENIRMSLTSETLLAVSSGPNQRGHLSQVRGDTVLCPPSQTEGQNTSYNDPLSGKLLTINKRITSC